jgi:hypothetical protein
LKQLQLIQILRINAREPAVAELAAANVRRVNACCAGARRETAASDDPDGAFAAQKSGELRPSALYRAVTLTSLRSGNLANRAGGRRRRGDSGRHRSLVHRDRGPHRLLMVRIDPDKVTPLKGEAHYLSKPARRGE